jgi:hypothetical protein
MTQDQLTKGQALLCSIDGLNALMNNLGGTSATLSKNDDQQIAGVDALIQQAFVRGLIKPDDLHPLIDLIYDRAAQAAKEYQSQFDSL